MFIEICSDALSLHTLIHTRQMKDLLAWSEITLSIKLIHVMSNNTQYTSVKFISTTHTHTQSNTSLLNTRHLHYQNKQTHKTKTITSYWKLHVALLRRFSASHFSLEMCDEYQTLAHMHCRWQNCRMGRFVVSSFKSLEYVCILKRKRTETLK